MSKVAIISVQYGYSGIIPQSTGHFMVGNWTKDRIEQCPLDEKSLYVDQIAKYTESITENLKQQLNSDRRCPDIVKTHLASVTTYSISIFDA